MIEVLRKRQELLDFISSLNEKSIGLVPTMGNLHEGHLSLLKESIKNNDISILTIFVNPKQFGPGEDFESYPRTLEEDLNKILSVVKDSKDVIVFAPETNNEIYPEGFSTVISLPEMAQILCGHSRPTHFDGVTTVVYQLFTLTKADNAYFGKKDYQQLAIIKQMAKDLNLEVNIHGLPIVREDSGLAMSSRNNYLSESEKQEALTLRKSILEVACAKKMSSMKGLAKKLKEEKFENKKWDYLEVLDSLTLSEPNEKTNEVVIAGAMFVGKARILDNEVVKID